MIEAPEYVTPTQRKLHDRYTDIHRKFFPSPPVFSKPQEIVEPPIIPPPTIIEKEPQKPILEPAKPAGPKIPINRTDLRLKLIKQAVCAEFNISEQTLLSERRLKEIVLPRHMFSYLASKFSKASLPRIGKSLGGRDHTTIMMGIRRMKERIRIHPELNERAMRLERILAEKFGDCATPRNCIGRYVPHSKVQDHFMLGWMWAANLNEYAALMIWPCACECVEPKE